MNSSTPSHQLDTMPIDELCINTIRTLAMDAVQQANSGHPGTPMALAPLAYVLWNGLMRYSPSNPFWPDRDRFVLSAGHASMLLYSVLHLVGYPLTLDDIKSFRQRGSRTPGHPERHPEIGIETTTGPLGQGLANSVGLAMAEAHLAAAYNRPEHCLFNHFTYAICSDGDLMEGISHEAASLAGHLRLGKLIWIYDDNHISIEGDTHLACSDDVAGRFVSYGWHVQDLGERANDVAAMTAALRHAQDDHSRPSLIVIRSHIAYGAPHAQDTAEAHGAPLGEKEVRATKEALGWPQDARFLVPERALAHMRRAVERGKQLESAWQKIWDAYQARHPQLARQLRDALDNRLPEGWNSSLPRIDWGEGKVATRKASGKVLNILAEKIPQLLGGSADLAPSTNTLLGVSGDFAADSYANRNIHWGIREHAMCSASNGLALHGGIRPYAATFLIFSDYARPAIRLAAMMGLPVVYVMTHDSIGLGEDGPTHQPIEQLASLRAIPGLRVMRPADANETAFAWEAALARTEGPTLLALTRQSLPVIDRTRFHDAEGVLRGGYVLAEEQGERPDAILIATGSEVHVALAARETLRSSQIDARVVSLPCWELFREQPETYRNEILPPDIKTRTAIEAASPLGWHEWVGPEGDLVVMRSFGMSAPGHEAFAHFGFSPEAVAERVLDLRERQHRAV